MLVSISTNLTIAYSKGDIDLLFWHIGTSHMHAGFNPNQALTFFYNFACKIRCPSTCIPKKAESASSHFQKKNPRLDGATNQVISMNSGPYPRIRSIRSKRFVRPCNRFEHTTHGKIFFKQCANLFCSWWKIFKGPPNAILLLSSLYFL